MPSPTRRHLLAGAALLLAGPARAQATPPLPVLATFSILADLVRQVGGDRVAVTTLVGPGGDAHVFQPSPADARRLAEAKLIVANGLGFEGWLPRLVKAAGAKGTLVTASRGVKPLAGEDGHGHEHGQDPHAWQDVGNVKLYVATIRDALAAADPAGAAVYRERAARYLAELDALDSEIRRAIATLPENRREIVTTHDAFAYFARAYGLRFLAAQGVSTEGEPTARDVGRIIRQIRQAKIPAVFLETVADPRLMQQIASESGARIGGRLYADTLTPPDGPAPTYVAMMRSNVRALTEALAG
jgi:zinc/manganese transport system substrate-binding protein